MVNKKPEVGDPARTLRQDETETFVMTMQLPKRAVMIPLLISVAVLDDGTACICVHPEVGFIRSQRDPVEQTREMFNQLALKLDELRETVVLQVMPEHGSAGSH